MGNKHKNGNRRKIVAILAISTVFFYQYSMLLENQHDTWIKKWEEKEVTVVGVINKKQKETDYQIQYQIKVQKIEDQNIKQTCFLLLKVPQKSKKVEVGDKIKVKGVYTSFSPARNENGWDARKYAKSQKQYGMVTTRQIEKLSAEELTVLENTMLTIRRWCEEKIKKLLPEEVANFYLRHITRRKRRNFPRSKTEFFDHKFIPYASDIWYACCYWGCIFGSYTKQTKNESSN